MASAIPTPSTTPATPKDHLRNYLNRARDTMLWKLDGLSEYDVRRPLTPTGTNLLGLVKHLASVELGYFGDCFDRPSGVALPWLDDDATPNDDMWATVDESQEQILGLYQTARDHADATFDALELDAPGIVPWWSDDRRNVTLLQIMVHMIAETNRHAGHADIVREHIDGVAGYLKTQSNLAPGDEASRQEYWQRLEAVARAANNAQP